MSGSLQTRNIITGAAEVYMSNESSLSVSWNTSTGAKVPTGTSGQSLRTDLDASTSWTNVGFTNTGVEFTYTPTYGEVTVDQLLDAALLFKTKMTAMVKTSLSEATLENLMVSWAQDPFGGEGVAPTYFGNGTTVNGQAQNATTGFPTGYDDNGVPTGALPLTTGEEQLGIAAGALGIEALERQMVFVGSSPRTSANKKRERVYHLRRVLSVSASAHSLKRDANTEFPVEFRLLPAEVSGAEYGTIRDRVITTV
jgi:hypothetical protein